MEPTIQAAPLAGRVKIDIVAADTPVTTKKTATGPMEAGKTCANPQRMPAHNTPVKRAAIHERI